MNGRAFHRRDGGPLSASGVNWSLALRMNQTMKRKRHTEERIIAGRRRHHPGEQRPTTRLEAPLDESLGAPLLTIDPYAHGCYHVYSDSEFSSA